MTDFLAFRRMLTPMLLMWGWYAVAGVSIVVGWFLMLGTQNGGGMGMALAVWAGGILGTRVLCEVLLVTFAIHERLTDLLHVESRRERILSAHLTADEAPLPPDGAMSGVTRP